MSVDYDLVIIGSSAAGVFAASVAANWNARVALVEQGQGCSTHVIAHQTILEVGRTLNQVQRANRLGLCDTEARSQTWKPQVWKQTQRWVETAERAIAVTDSAAVLASRGVEVIAGSGEFHRKPALGFLVNGRSLRSRAYLLAMENLPVIEKLLVKFFSVNPPASTLDIPGLEAAGYQTARTVLQQEAIDHLNRVVILGSNATEVELAQTLQRLGRSVTLVTPAKHILHLEDPQAAYLIQAQLEAEGVQILTQTAVTQVRQI
ncbi:FAD-dependent oxidoreductase, partial [Leptolyngbya sp. FACHB-36]|uniref:FAD-dependent oxidoreductase n=1 Tax=Leptolyngbya sp. FACHB-36 TaxID=2692808 RepID=UPI0016802E23